MPAPGGGSAANSTPATAAEQQPARRVTTRPRRSVLRPGDEPPGQRGEREDAEHHAQAAAARAGVADRSGQRRQGRPDAEEEQQQHATGHGGRSGLRSPVRSRRPSWPREANPCAAGRRSVRPGAPVLSAPRLPPALAEPDAPA